MSTCGNQRSSSKSASKDSRGYNDDDDESSEVCWYCKPSLLMNGIGLEYDIAAFFTLPVFKFIGAHSDGSTFSRIIADKANVKVKVGDSFDDVLIDNPYSGESQSIRIHRPNRKFSGKLPVAFYCHGGGFCLFTNKFKSYSDTCSDMANEGMIVVNVDYRLAPEHPFPAAPLDCFNALKWLASEAGKAALPTDADLSRVVMVGDSAGGNLALVVTQLMRDNLDGDGVTSLTLTGLTIVHSLIIYPWLLLKEPTASYQDPTLNMILVPEILKFFKQSYLPVSKMQDDRRCQPLSASMEGLPPMTVVTASYDRLRDEGRLLVKEAREAGVNVAHIEVKAPHGFLTMTPDSKPYKQAWGFIAKSLNEIKNNEVGLTFSSSSAERRSTRTRQSKARPRKSVENMIR